MSRKERAKAARLDRLEALLAEGAHRAAGEAARAVLADQGASDEERAGAARVRRSLRPEPGAVLAGALAAALAVVVALWTVLRG
ncbi:MAG: hypothetical protein QM767_05585 [Anaeromyxobacter sp.]